MALITHLVHAAVIGAALELAAAGAAAQPALARSQGYPNKPIRWIVPFAPGAAADILSRAITQKLTESWGQQIVIDFRPGAGGSLGTQIAAGAAPDGYTVILVPASFASSPSLYSKPPYDPVKDFAPVTLVAASPLILVVHPSMPVTSVKELVALAKARPGELNYASSGIGVGNHLAAELFKSMKGVNIFHVPYKGNAPALIDLMGGQIHMMFPNAPSALPHIKAGKLRALAVTTLRRSALLPELPTLAESGLPGFEANNWAGLVAPAGTPQAIIGKLHSEVVRSVKLPDVHQRLVNLGFEPTGNTSQEFAAYIRTEIATWNKVIRAAGIRAD